MEPFIIFLVSFIPFILLLLIYFKFKPIDLWTIFYYKWKFSSTIGKRKIIIDNVKKEITLFKINGDESLRDLIDSKIKSAKQQLNKYKEQLTFSHEDKIEENISNLTDEINELDQQLKLSYSFSVRRTFPKIYIIKIKCSLFKWRTEIKDAKVVVKFSKLSWISFRKQNIINYQQFSRDLKESNINYDISENIKKIKK